MAREPKNIWIAAGDGDLDRVKQFSIPRRHAAASYGQVKVLDYLISRGGDVNITDADGDTPLYTVENLETARYLVEHGAIVARQNLEGVSPIDHLTEDFPEIADYLRSTLDPSVVPLPQFPTPPSQHSQEMASEQLTTSLMSSVQEIMQRAENEGRDPEEELRQAVGRHVLEGVLTGYGMGTENENARGPDGQPESSAAKRSRSDEGSG
ncbi:hypothetical protein CVT26_012553 [Gymnopilus dilepis]|uniref:Uncharacterized protein n=1 Tax=Gymnopilus dilepis TaxID=231916 RepID=A0A409WD92_9AGAR|nr:hypothetical protein CVT26_012553 [Gymnopilus dilepis]